jgi:hypothetical protein
MYDGGNYLSTDLGGSIPYSNDTIDSRPDLLGAGGRYFTRKYPGLFVFVADVSGLQHFTISGNLGADGAGFAAGSVLETVFGGTEYLGFVKRVYGSVNPSVNHLIIVESDPVVSHEFSTYTNDDYHRLTGATGVHRIHYLLYAGIGGALIDDTAALEIMNAYLGVSGVGWLSVDPSEGTLPAGQSAPIDLTVNAADLDDGDYTASVVFHSNDPDEPTTVIPVDLHVTGVPDIAVYGLPVLLESVSDYRGSGAATNHVFVLPSTPFAGGTVIVDADGDFGASSEYATVSAEGYGLGEVGRVGSDCSVASETFAITPATMATLASDGEVSVMVDNSYAVDDFCSVNRHTVQFGYDSPADYLDFGSLFIGLSKTLAVVVRNEGTAPLVVGTSSDDSQFAAPTTLTVPEREEAVLEVTFSPTVAQVNTATLTLTTNDPDTPTYTIALTGEGLIPPDIEISPPALHADLYTGGSTSQTLDVANTGGSDLIWEGALDTAVDSAVVDSSPVFEGQAVAQLSKDVPAEPPAPSTPENLFVFPARAEAPPEIVTHAAQTTLESVLVELDAHHGEVNSKIPNRYDFIDGTTGTRINDGGNDMYDGGNYLYTGLGGPLQYTDGPIVSHAAWGATGRYFTKKYPGLFVMVADSDAVGEFRITGNLGADGAGFADGSVLQSSVGGRTYLGFVKRVYGAYDPSVNHLIIVETDPDVNHAFATNTDDDYHRVFNLTNVRRVHYLLYAASSGGYIDDVATLAIMNAYLDVLPRAWLTVEPVSGVVPAGGVDILDAAFDSTGLPGGDYSAVFTVASNDPDETAVDVPITLHVTDAPDIELRGGTTTLESTRGFDYAGAATVHEFEDVFSDPEQASIEVTVDGDFGSISEIAAVSADGVYLGQAGRTGTDCIPATASFAIPAPQLAVFLEDSALTIVVQNSGDVDVSCSTNEHRVRFIYTGRTDHLVYGPTFIGVSRTLELVVANEGPLTLNVHSATSDHPEFVVSPTALTVAPGGETTLQIVYSPSTVGAVDGILTLVSDDPDEGTVSVSLSGVGVIPPDIDVTPDSMTETLLINHQVTRTLTIANTSVGGADLEFDLAVGLAGMLAPPIAPMLIPRHADEDVFHRESDRPEDALATDHPPEGHSAVPVLESTMSGATVLLLQDNAPWGGNANQRILTANGIAYDLVNVSSLISIDLTRYRMVIVGSDQTTSFYRTLSSLEGRLDEYVTTGGTLEFHGAGWGRNGGNASLVVLPGQVGIERYSDRVNHVVQDHPIVDGVPAVLPGTYASHAYLLNLPVQAETLVTDQPGHPTLALYTHGAGRVVVGTQPLEYYYDRGGAIGLILNNMIPWVHQSSTGVGSWLSPVQASGIVASGSSVSVDMTFDATGLSPSVYEKSIVITSNDPDEPEVVVPTSMNAVRLIAEAGPPQELECDGGGAAMTVLDGTASQHMIDPSYITDYWWTLDEDVLGSDAVITVPIPLGANTVVLEIMDATGATSTDETTITVLDRIAPVGTITYPPSGACLGPPDVPVIVLDDYTDICSESLIRIYDPPGGPAYSDQGDYAVTLQVSDPSGNPGPTSYVDFTIDVIAPNVVIHGPGEGVTVPGDLPFSVLFDDDDEDGADGDVVHERVFLDDCLLYDGWTYGETLDGLLRDETLHFDLCRIFQHCGITSLDHGILRVEAIDCGGNVGFATRQIGGSITLGPDACEEP